MEESKRKGKTERVMVHVRVRPFNDDESGRGRESGIETIDPKSSSICIRKEADRKNFTFDSVFDASCTQEDIYLRVGKPVVESVLQGYNSTILTYGQTGTGKTHTMIGGKGETRGVIPRAVQNIFDNINSDTAHSYKISVAFLQIYMEMIQDLLVPDNPKAIRIREDPEEGVYVSGISWVPVAGLKDCMELMTIGDKNRNTAFTHMNSHSSRSHAVYMVKLEKRVRYTREQIEEIQNAGNSADQSVVSSILHLVDLAGSERVKKSKAVGSRLDEAKNINLSLLTLGNCIQALADKKVKFVPYRDSKLTRLLEDSLGGNSKTSLIVTVGPSKKHLQETISSLQFGSRAMKVENRPEINKQIDYKALCAQLQSDLDKVHDNNSHFYIREQELLNEISKLKEELKKVTTEKEDLEIMIEELKSTAVRAGSPRDSEELERTRRNDIKKIQTHYREKLRKQEEEHKKFLEEIDRLMLDQETDLNNMRNDIVNLREKNKTLKREKDSIEKSLSEEIASLREELERVKNLETQIGAKDNEISRLNREVEIIMNEKKGLGSEIEKIKSENEGLKIGNSKQAADLKSAQELVMQFEAQIKKMKDAQMAMHKDFQMKSKGFAHTIKKYKSGIVEQMNEFWKVIQDNMQNLGYKNKGLDSRIKGLEILLPKIQTFKQKKINDAKSLKLELVDKLREMKLSKDKIMQLNTDITNLSQRSQQQDSSFAASYKISKKNISNLMNAFSQVFNMNITKIYESVKVQEKRVMKLEGAKKLMQSYIAEKTKVISSQMKGLADKDSQLKNTEIRYEKMLQEARYSLKQVEVELKKQIETLTITIKQKEDTISRLTQENSLLQTELEATSKSLTDTLSSKTSENEALHSEILKHKTEINQLRTDMQKLNNTLDTNKKLLESKITELSTANTEAQNLTQNIKELQSTNTKLITQIKQAQLKTQEGYDIAKRDIASMYRSSNQYLNHIISKVYDSLQVSEQRLNKLDSLKRIMHQYKENQSKNTYNLLDTIKDKETQLNDNQMKYHKMLTEAARLQKKTELELSNRIESLNTTIQAKEDEIRKLESEKTSVEKEFTLSSNSLTDSIRKMNHENHSLKSELSATKAEISNLKTDVSKYQIDIERLNGELQNTKDELLRTQSNAGDTIARLNEEISKCRSECDIAARELQNTKNELSNLQINSKSEIVTLKSEISQYRMDLDNTNRDLLSTQNEFSILQDKSKSEIANLNSIITKLQNELDYVSKTLENTQQELADIKSKSSSQISHLNSELSKYKLELDTTSQSYESIKQELSNLEIKSKSELDQIKTELLKSQTDLANKSKQLKNTMQILDETQKKSEIDISQLKAEISRYESELDNATKRLISTQQEFSYLQNNTDLDISHLKSEISKLKIDLTHTTKNLEDTQCELSDIKTKSRLEIIQLTSEITQYQGDSAQNVKDLEFTKSALHDLQIQYKLETSLLKSETTQYQNDLSYVNENLELTKRELADTLKQLKDSKDLNVQLSTTISDLRKEIKNRQTKYEQSYLICQKSIKSLLETFRIEWYQINSKYEDSIDAMNEKIKKFEDLRLKLQGVIQKNHKIVSNHIQTIQQKDIQIKLYQEDFNKQLDAAKVYQQNFESDYKASIERLNNTISDQSEEIEKLITHKRMIESNLDETSKSLNDNINFKIQENQALSSRLEEAKIEITRLNIQLDKLSAALNHKEQIISNNLDEIKSYTSKIQDLNSIIDQLKRDIVQRDERYTHNFKLAKRDISELVSATNSKLNDQISIYTQHIQALQSKLTSLESVKKLIKKSNITHFQTITNLQITLDRLKAQLQNTEQSYKQSISDAVSLQKKTESDFQAESSRLSHIISQKDDEIKRLLSDKSMMANNLDSTCRVLNDSLQLQIQQNKTLDAKLDEASREISRLNQEVTSKAKELEIKSRELEKCLENLLQANEKGKELSMMCSNLENNLKLNRQSYNSAIKLSKDTISNISGNINKNMQELIKNMSDKIETLQAKVIHLEQVKPIIIRKISNMNISIQDKSKTITAIQLDLKNTEEEYKRLLEDADKLQKKTEQDYTHKLNSLNLALKQKDEECQKLTLDKHSIENTAKSLTDALQSKSSENQALSSSISEAESEISKLKNEIADYRSASNKSSISLSQLEKELSTLREDLKSKNQRILDLNSLNTTLHTDIKSKEKAFIDSFRQAKRNITQLCESAAKNMQLEMKRLSNSIQILEIKQRKLEATKDDIQKNNLKKSLIISKLTSALKDKENQLINLFSKDKSNYQVIERLRKDQEEIVSAKDDEIQSMKEEIVGYINKIKILESNIQSKDRDIIEISTKLEENEGNMMRAMKEYKIESERKLEEANSSIESLTLQLSLRDKESGSEISSLTKLYQDTIENHQQDIDSLTKNTKKREEELLSQIDKLSKQLKNKEADYFRLEKKSASFKSMYDSLKSLVNTLHEKLPKIRCKSTSAQSWLLKYLNLKLPSDSNSYNLLTSVLGVYNSISHNKANLTPSILTQISDMYIYKQTENSSIESTQDSMPIFKEYSEEIYGVVNDMLNLLEAQDMILQEQTYKASYKQAVHSKPVIFTGNITDKSKLGIISNLDRLKVPLNKFLTRLIPKPDENIDIIPDSKPLAQDAIISLFDSPANTDSMKALHEIGETVDNMKQLLLNLSNFISLLGAYSSILLNTNLSLEKSLSNSQNLISSLFSVSNYQSIKLHNKRLNLQNTKLRLNFLSQEYTNFKKNLEEETTTTLMNDKSARTIQRFWRHKLKQRNIRIALKEKLAMLQEKKRRLDDLEQFRKKLKEDRLKQKENIEKKKAEIHTARRKTYQNLKQESRINEEIKKQHQSFSRDQVVQRKMSLKSTINISRHQRVFSARFLRENIEKEYEIRMKQETLAKEEAEKKLEKLSKIESQIMDMLKKSCEDNDKALNSLLEITCPSQKSIQVSSQLASVDTSVQGKLMNPEPRPMSPEREVP